MSEENMDALAEQFAAVTGASATVGLRALSMCNGDLQRAISMHLDGLIDVDAMEGAQQEAGSASSALEAAGPSILHDDSVRAPIPSKMDTLVEDVPKFGLRPRQRRARQSVFDGLRDFQAETRLQEEMIRDPKLSSRKRTLEDLFRPPLDLMHKGTFITARETGQAQGKWLMVNVQNVREFSCQTLNRDVWSDVAVKSIIRESFIFWQVYHDSDEGRRYMQFYKVTEFPYVAILDPRTGEQMATWNRVDTQSFCDVVMQFLSDHKMDIPDVIPLSPPADSPSSSLLGPPAKKKARTDSIIDASEESQIEAAIAASLAEAEAVAQGRSANGGAGKATTSAIPIASDSEPEEIDDDDDDGDDGVETIDSDFAFSDSEHAWDDKSSRATKPTNGTVGGASQQRTSVIVDNSHKKVAGATGSKNTDGVAGNKLVDIDGSSCSNKSVDDVDGNSCSSSSKNSLATSSERTETSVAKNSNGLTACRGKSVSETNSFAKRTADPRRPFKNIGASDDTDSKETLEKMIAEDDSQEESEDDVEEEISGPTARILLRLPDGKRKEICLSASATLKALASRVAKVGFSEEKYELLTTFPRRRLSTLDSDTSLSDAGLCPQESIFVQER